MCLPVTDSSAPIVAHHTPGPYEAAGNKVGNDAYGLIATTHGPQADENAQLLRAAPTLINHLQVAIAAVREANAAGNPILRDWLPSAERAVREAVAR